MIPQQEPGEIPKLLACCDAAFLSFSDTPLWERTIPAKLQSYMACGMPIIAAARGETEQIVKEAGCGVCVPIGDAKELAKSIQNLMLADLKLKSESSRLYAQSWFNKEKRMNQMDKWFDDSLHIDQYRAEVGGRRNEL